ncbi:NlpC/P60 family protein [Streptomyces sp. NPDC020298]|uniref:C40 family peptidase n=1 Tax=unclassified Streptomyces TaxID=2593676 RepID=UPI00340D97C9
MASHRKRPSGGAGIRKPALATAALTSVALLSQTANAAPATPSADGKPSMEEVEKKVDDLYRQAESATEKYNATKETAGKQRRRVDTLLDEVAKRTERLNKAREKLGSFAAAQYRTGATTPDTATFLLADTPQDYFDQAQLMSRLTKRQKNAVDDYVTEQSATMKKRQEATASLETLTDSQHDLQAAKSTVQKKLTTARELLSTLTAQEKARLAAIEKQKQEEAARKAAELAKEQAAARAKAQQQNSGSSDASTSTGSSSDTSTPAPPSTPSSPTSSSSAKAAKAIAFARAQIGKPYVWGATGPGSYDCSGLTQAAWKAAGVSLPRTTYDQVNAGTTVSLANAQPGDLVFFYDDVSHVGVYIGNGMMIHAPKPGAYVREESIYYGGESIIHSVVRPA